MRKRNKKSNAVLALVLSVVMIGSTGLFAFADLEGQNASTQDGIAGQARNDEGAVSDEGVVSDEGAVGDEDSVSGEDSESDIAGDEVDGDDISSSDMESDADTDATPEITPAQLPEPIETSPEDAAITILEDDPTEVYVSNSGSDSDGEGTVSKPFATLEKAFDVASSDNPATVFLMSDIEMSSQATLSPSQEITIKSNDATPRNILRSDSDSGYKGYLLNIPSGAELTLEEVTIDGNKANVAAIRALISVAGKLTLKSSTVRNNKNTSEDANYGGGISLTGNAQVIIDSSTVTGNEAYVGAGIYYGSGSLTVKGTPLVGTTTIDNGIYLESGDLKVTIDGSLAGGSRVNIENKNGAQVGAVVAVTKDGSNAAATGFDWLTRAYDIQAQDDKLVLAVKETDFYVDGVNGDDNTANGSLGAPYKTTTKAMDNIPRGPLVEAKLIIKDDTAVDQSIITTNLKKLTIEKWASAAAGTKLMRAAGFTEYMLQINPDTELELNDMTLDGNKAAGSDALVFVGGGIFTQNDSVITDNYSKANGGGVYLSSGKYYLNGGSVIGNRAATSGSGQGSEVYYFGGEMHITGGSPVIGNGNKVGSLYSGLYLNNSKYIYLDANLSSPSKVFFEAIGGAAEDRVIVTKTDDGVLAPVNTTEKKIFVVADNSYGTKLIAEDNTYVLKAAAYYVASPGGTHDGKDTNSGTEEFPFATISKAINAIIAAIPSGGEADIIVMEDIRVDSSISFTDINRNVNLRKWDEAGTDVVIKRGDGFKGNMFNFASGNFLTLWTFSVYDLIIDGNNSVINDLDATSSIFVLSGGTTNAMFPSLALYDTIIQNNTAATSPIRSVNGNSIPHVSLYRSTIKDCHTKGQGGAINIAGGLNAYGDRIKLFLQDTTITGNVSDAGSHGIYTNGNNGGISFGGDMHIGLDENDNNGIWSETNGSYVPPIPKINKTLSDTANVNFSYLINPYSALTVIEKLSGAGATDATEASKLHYQPGPFEIEVNPSNTTTYRLSDITEWYVASDIGSFTGSDVVGVGQGTEAKPFASLAKAFEMTGFSPTNVYVMDNIVISKVAKVVGLNNNTAPASQRKITVSGKDNVPHTVTRNEDAPYLGYFFDVNFGTTLILNDLIYDGNGGNIANNASSIIFMQSPGANATAKTSVTLNSGELINNKAAGSGGAVLMESTAYDGSRSIFTMNGGEISGNYAAVYGGGIYSGRGSALIINNGSVIKNNKSGTENGEGDNPGSTIGNDIYALQRTAAEFTVDGLVEIGTKTSGEGIYLAYNTSITSKNLLAGTDITFEFRYFSAHNDTIITNGATDKTVDNAGMFSYFPQVYNIEYNATDKNYHLIATRDVYYVSQTIGDDILGDGSEANPLYTIPLAFRAVQAGRVSRVVVMDDNSMKTQAIKTSGKAITVEGWDGYNGSTDYPLVTGNGIAGSMFDVAAEAAGSAEANRLIMKDLIIDGSGVDYPIVNVGDTGSSYSAKFEMQSGKLQNYVSKAVLVNGGTATNTNLGVFRMLGGEIGGVSATVGYAVNLNSSNGRATLELAGAPKIGLNSADGGVFIGDDAQFTKITVLNNLGDGSNLKDGASINFSAGDIEEGWLIVKDITETSVEASYFHAKTFRLDPTGETPERGYIATCTQRDFYVASPDGPYHGDDLNGDGTKEHPFESIAMAFLSTPVKQDCHVYVLDDIDYGQVATETKNHRITLSSAPISDRLADDPLDGGDATATRTATNRNGLIRVQHNAQLTIDDLIFDGNKAASPDLQPFWYGGIPTNAPIRPAIWITTDTQGQSPIVNLEDGFVLKNYIVVDTSYTANPYDSSIIFVGTTADWYEGKIGNVLLNATATLNLNGAVIKDNAVISQETGGALMGGTVKVWTNGVLNMTGGSISKNYVRKPSQSQNPDQMRGGAYGGGICAPTYFSTVNITDAVLDGNEARSYDTWGGRSAGGNIYANGTVTIIDSTIKNGVARTNDKECYGGNICIDGGGSLTMTGGSITNGASWYGAAVFIGGASYLSSADRSRTSSRAAWGGSVNFNTGNNTIRDNKSGRATLSGVTITGNGGHGVYSSSTGWNAGEMLRISDCTITNNYDYDVYLTNQAARQLDISGKTIIGNSRKTKGLYLQSNDIVGINADLDPDAKIYVRTKVSATVNTVIATKAKVDSEGTLAVANPEQFIWGPPGGVIAQDENVPANLILKPAPIYVSELTGNDATGDGSVDNPFKSFAFINDVSGNFTANIYVMDDITVNSTVTITSKNLYFHKWDGADGEVRIKRGTGTASIMELLGSPYITFGELTFDGDRTSGNNNPLITMTSGTVNLRGTKIINNYGQKQGLYMSNGTVNMYEGSEIAYNNATTAQHGAGVLMDGGTFNLIGGSIHDNSASRGGGILVYAGSKFNMTGGRIENNTASSLGGGGIFAENGGTVSISGGILTGNIAASGAAIYVADTSKLNISGEPVIGYDETDNGIFMGNASSNITVTGDLGPGSVVVIQGKASAAAGTLIARKTGGMSATLLESGYFIWKNGLFRVVPDGDSSYKLVTLLAYYVSGREGHDESITGTKNAPFRTIEHAFEVCPTVGANGEDVYVVIYVMDDSNGLGMESGVTVQPGQNITLQRMTGATQRSINIPRSSSLTDAMFSIEAGGSLLISDLNINGSGIAGAGPIISTEGLFMLTSGSLQNNKSVGTAAVELIGPDAEFDLDGGLIMGNVSTGGVGAVNIGDGTFRMQGGTISDNTSATKKGAVTLGSSTSSFIMLGGEIVNNNEYAVLFEQGSVSMGGDAKIGASKRDNGIYLGADRVITLLSDMSKGNRVNIAGKAGVIPDGTGRGTVITEKQTGSGIALVNDNEALKYYWQPGFYSIEAKSDGNTYVLGNLKAAFIDAIPNGEPELATTTQIRLVFDEELSSLDLAGITLTPGLKGESLTDLFTIDKVKLEYAGFTISTELATYGEIHYQYDLFVIGDWEDGDVLESIHVYNGYFDLTPDTLYDRTLYRDITDYTVTFIGNADDTDSIALVEGATSVARLVPDIGMSIKAASTDARVINAIPALTTGIPSKVSYAGHKFLGWSTDPNGLTEGTAFTEDTQISGDTFVYAIWYKYKTFAISFEGNGADDALWQQIKSITEPSTKLDGLPLPPERFGYTFTGWNTKANGSGSVFNLDSLVTSDGSVYAQWSKNPDPPTPPVPPLPPVPPTPPTPPVDTPETPITPTQPVDTPVAPVTPTPPVPALDVGPTADQTTPTPVVDPDTDDTTIVITRAEADSILARANGIAAGIGSSVGGSIKSVGDNISQIIENFQDGNVPASAGAGENAWAFLNLILAIIGVALVLVTLFVKIAKRRNDERIEDEYGHTDDDEHKRKTLRWFIVAILLGVIGVVLFCLTEDMSLPMVWFDKWTIVQAVILALGLVSTFFANRRDKEDEEVTYV